MELGDYIFYIVLFGAWLLPFLAKKLAPDKTSSARKGVTFRILEFIAKLNSAAEEQANTQQVVMSQQTPTIPKKRGVTASQTASSFQQKQRKPKIEAVITSEVSLGHSPQITDPPVKVQQRFSRKKMQEAIIWSEILQAPVALRD